MSENMGKVYAEVYSILNFIDEYYVNKISTKFIEYIYKKKDNNYVPDIDMNIPIEEQELLEDTVSVLALIKYNYWCENEQEKKELVDILNQKEEKYQEELRKKYSPDDIFKKEEELAQTQELVVYKDNLFKRMINKLKAFLKLKK